MDDIVSEIKNILSDYTVEFHLNYDLILLQIKVESNFDPNAISPSGLVGLFQIKNETYIDIKERILPIFNYKIQGDLTNIKVNLALGCIYMRWLLNLFGNSYYYSFMLYNLGIGTVTKLKNWRQTQQVIRGEPIEYVYKIFKEAGVCQYF